MEDPYKARVMFLLSEILKSLNRLKPKPRKVKQNGLWKSVPAPPSKWDIIQKSNEEDERKLQKQLAAERARREEKEGVVGDPVARKIAEAMIDRTRRVTGRED